MSNRDQDQMVYSVSSDLCEPQEENNVIYSGAFLRSHVQNERENFKDICLRINKLISHTTTLFDKMEKFSASRPVDNDEKALSIQTFFYSVDILEAQLEIILRKTWKMFEQLDNGLEKWRVALPPQSKSDKCHE
jgi:hypothetical protein